MPSPIPNRGAMSSTSLLRFNSVYSGHAPDYAPGRQLTVSVPFMPAALWPSTGQ